MTPSALRAAARVKGEQPCEGPGVQRLSTRFLAVPALGVALPTGTFSMLKDALHGLDRQPSEIRVGAYRSLGHTTCRTNQTYRGGSTSPRLTSPAIGRRPASLKGSLYHSCRVRRCSLSLLDKPGSSFGPSSQRQAVSRANVVRSVLMVLAPAVGHRSGDHSCRSFRRSLTNRKSASFGLVPRVGCMTILRILLSFTKSLISLGLSEEN